MKYGSRKFIVSMFVIASADVLVWLGTIEPSVWGATVGTVVAAYIAGNVTQKATTKS